MSEVVVAAPAKVNLFLHVLDRETTGFHAIETLFAALELHDTVTVRGTVAPGVDLRVEGDHDLGPPARNLAVLAAERYLERAGRGAAAGAEIVLEKAIPPGAGLGGGSSDAAAVLRAMSRIHDGAVGRPELVELASDLGSDVPFFLASTPMALAWGRGDRLLGLPPLPGRPVLVILPGFRVPTAGAYEDLDRMRSDGDGEAPTHRRGGRLLETGDLSSWDTVAELAHNDFCDVVVARRPEIEEMRSSLERDGAGPCLVAGSGSAVFGVFAEPEAAGAARRRLMERFPGIEVRSTRTLGRWPSSRPA